MKDTMQRRTMTPHEVSEIYGIPEGSLANLRCNKQGAKYFKVGRRVLYFIDDFEAWLRMNPVLTTDVLERLN
jgi:hypothetical protein